METKSATALFMEQVTEIIHLLEQEGDWQQMLCYTFARLSERQGRELLHTLLKKMLEKECSVYLLHCLLEYCLKVVDDFWFELFALYGNRQAFVYAMNRYKFGQTAFEKLFSIRFGEARFKLVLDWLSEERVDIFEILHQSGPDSVLMLAMQGCSTRKASGYLLCRWLEKNL